MPTLHDPLLVPVHQMVTQSIDSIDVCTRFRTYEFASLPSPSLRRKEFKARRHAFVYLGVPIAEQNAELIAISRVKFTSLQERNPTPKAESAFPQLSQWLNRTLRSIVPKTLEELFAGNSIH